MLPVIVTIMRVFPPPPPALFYSHTFSELFQMTPWPRSSSLLRPLLHLIFLKNYLCWLSVTLSTPTFITWNKHRYCRCRPPVVTFVYCEFGTLSCATKLEKVPHFCTKYSRDWQCSPVISPDDIGALISWHRLLNYFFSVALNEQFH